MDYKYVVINNNHVVRVDNAESFAIAKGNPFRRFLSDKFPEANSNFVIAYKDAPEIYSLATPDREIEKQLNSILENEWIDYTWPENPKIDEEE